jgi:SAM-dependent methyltransferase
MSFGAIAEDYDRLRPPPAEAAVDWLLPAAARVVADLGAGTGLLSRALARRVPRVIAVEPDERMAAVLRARDPAIEVLPGRGEAIPLPDASADGVFISSAWHWMDPGRAVPEIARVLRDGGRFGVIWTSRDHEAGWVRELHRLREPGPPAEPDPRPEPGPLPEPGPPAEPDPRPEPGPAAELGPLPEPGPLPGTGEPDGQGRPWARRREVTLPDGSPFGAAETASFAFRRVMTVDDVVDMLGTYSGLITASPQDRAVTFTRLRAALEQWFPGADEIDMPLRSVCWRADRKARTSPK